MDFKDIPRISIASFKNSRKEKANQPDFTGFGDVGSEFIESLKQLLESGKSEIPLRVAGWNKTSKKGNNFISYSIQIDTYQMEQAEGQSIEQDTVKDESPW